MPTLQAATRRRLVRFLQIRLLSTDSPVSPSKKSGPMGPDFFITLYPATVTLRDSVCTFYHSHMDRVRFFQL